MPEKSHRMVENARRAQFCRKLPNTRRSGFTLIELLVVIAIISILASMLFPAFSRARESARKIVCISNMKQIGLGIMQYTQDYDESYPIGYPFWEPSITPATERDLLVNVVNPYIKSTQVWSCPSWRGVYTGTSSYIGNYGFITGSNNLIGVPNLLPPSSLAGTSDPTNYPLIFCGIAPQQTADGIGKMTAHAGVSDEEWKDGALAGNSILYADGHAKYSVLTYGKWNEMYNTPR